MRELIERTRAYTALGKSKFVRLIPREKAEGIIATYEKTLFPEDDWHNFFDSIDNPPKPSKRMIRAAKKYKEITNRSTTPA